MTSVPCPRCQTMAEWTDDNPYRPFCSQRCKLSDLDGWLTEEYTIPVADSPPTDSPEDEA
ncbi:MAG: DNA gyrase inhibitor YacG [Gammaproteobacteria bacterium]